MAKGGVRLSMVASHADGADRPLRRGDKVQLSFEITDLVAKEGLAGLHLGAWLVPRPARGQAPDEKAIREMVRKLIASNLSAGSYTNLNTYYFATLNEDKSLALMNPFLDFSRTKMKSILELPSVGADLATGPGDQLIFVSLPMQGQVWAVDSLTLEVRQKLSTGVSPRRLAKQPGSGYVWVSDDAGERVYVIDGISGKVAGSIVAGPGEKRFAFDAEGLRAYICCVATGKIIAVESLDLTPTNLVDLGASVSGFVWSEAADALFVLLGDSGDLEIVRPRNERKTTAPSLPPGSGPLYASDDGRWLFAVDSVGGRVHVLDAATGEPPRAIETDEMPSQIVITQGFAHVYCEGSRFLTLIQLSALADGGSVPTLRIPITQKTPAKPNPSRVGAFLAKTPEEDSVLVASADEKLVYYYKEGMMAPMGSYQNYSRVPVAVGVVDRSLQDSGSGIYTAVVSMDYHGKVDVFTYLDDPTQVFGHFEIDVEPDAESIEEQERSLPLALLEPVEASPTLPVGDPASFRFRLLDREDREPIRMQDDVRVLAHARYGNWQVRLPAEALDDGTYQVSFRLPEKGAYLVNVESRGLNLRYTSQPPMEVNATDDVEARPSSATANRGGESSDE